MRRGLGNSWTASAHPFAPDPDAGTGTGTGAAAGAAAGTGAAGGTGTGGEGAGGAQGSAGAAGGTGTTAPAVPATLDAVTAESGWADYAAANGIPAVGWRELDPAQQATYWQFHARKNEARIPGNLPDLQAKARQWDDFEAASRTQQEQALLDAEQRGRNAGRAEVATSTVGTLIRAGIGDRRTAEEVDALLAPLDLTRFVGDNGAVDAARVTAFVQTIVGGNPGGGGTGQQRHHVPGMGQGHRTDTTGKASAADGAARYAERRKAGQGATRNGSGQ